MPSTAEAREFDRRIAQLIKAAAEAEQADVDRILGQIAAVQRDLRAVVTSGDGVAVMVARAEKRLETLEDVLGRIFVDAVPDAVARGAGMIDAGFTAVGLDAGAATVVDVGTGPTLTLRTVARQQVADLQAKVVYQLTRLTGPNPAGVDDILRAIGSRLNGSQVFGGPAARAAAAFEAIVGDVTGLAMTERAGIVDQAGGPRTLKRWVHSSGVREPRADHVAAAARPPIPWGQNFIVGSYRTPRPRGPGLPGPQRFGCRCQVAPALAQEEPNPTRSRRTSPASSVEPSPTAAALVAPPPLPRSTRQRVAVTPHPTRSPWEPEVARRFARSVADDWKLDPSLDGNVRVRMSADSLASVLADGRFKSQHESGKSGGVFYPERRKQHELDMFGDHEVPPIYGYVNPAVYSSKRAAGDSLWMYGDLDVELRASVIDRTTITFGDSLQRDSPPLPIPATEVATAGDDPLASAWANTMMTDKAIKGQTTYVEAQVHNGLAATDIAAVIGDVPDALRSELEARGIIVKARKKK